MNMNNNVSHPSHYIAGRKYEPKDVIRDWDLNFSLGNAVKYISRAGRKDPSKTIEDLEKAIFYINDEIAALRNAEEDLAQQECENAERALFVTGLCTEYDGPEHPATTVSSGGGSYTFWASSDCEVSAE